MGRELCAPLTAVLLSTLLLGVAALGYVVERGDVVREHAGRAVVWAEARLPDRLTHRPPTRTTPARQPATVEAATPTESVTYRPGVTLALRPELRRVLGAGDSGERVRDLQARLRQLAWYAGSTTGRFDRATRDGVRGFQDKRGLRTPGFVDGATLARLRAMTTTPSRAERHDLVGSSATTAARLDSRCTTGRAICVDKTSQTLRWVVDGNVRGTMAVRFGAAYTPTREGVFSVQRKSADHVSTIFHTAMPYAMFFSGGQAVHYSSDFAARGYAGASHGCVNVRDHAGVAWLFSQVRLGDAVVVYRS